MSGPCQLVIEDGAGKSPNRSPNALSARVRVRRSLWERGRKDEFQGAGFGVFPEWWLLSSWRSRVHEWCWLEERERKTGLGRERRQEEEGGYTAWRHSCAPMAPGFHQVPKHSLPHKSSNPPSILTFSLPPVIWWSQILCWLPDPSGSSPPHSPSISYSQETQFLPTSIFQHPESPRIPAVVSSCCPSEMLQSPICSCLEKPCKLLEAHLSRSLRGLQAPEATASFIFAFLRAIVNWPWGRHTISTSWTKFSRMECSLTMEQTSHCRFPVWLP
jgi:hypothetical protein